MKYVFLVAALLALSAAQSATYVEKLQHAQDWMTCFYGVIGISIDVNNAVILGETNGTSAFAAEFASIWGKVQAIMTYFQNQDYVNTLLYANVLATEVTDFIENFTTYLPTCYSIYQYYTTSSSSATA